MKTWRSALFAFAVMCNAGEAMAADPIKIGVTGPFTGGSSPMGISMRNGVKLAVDEINESAGILGRRIQIVERDDEARNDLGIQIAEDLIYKENVTATLGFVNTGVAYHAQSIYQNAEIPVIVNVATGTINT
jgi:branched-chain amino acid transport system substrate-binding protein